MEIIQSLLVNRVQLSHMAVAMSEHYKEIKHDLSDHGHEQLMSLINEIHDLLEQS